MGLQNTERDVPIRLKNRFQVKTPRQQTARDEKHKTAKHRCNLFGIFVNLLPMLYHRTIRLYRIT